MTVSVYEDRVRIDGFEVVDARLAGLLSPADEEGRGEILARVLATGAAGLVSMSVGLDLAEIDEQVRHSYDAAAAAAARRLAELVDEVRRSLDPELRSSALAKALAELVSFRDELARSLDPSYADSHSARLLAELETFFAPRGVLQERLEAVLDAEAGSTLATHLGALRDEMVALREAVAERRGRETEAERGTAKGRDFESTVDDLLRRLARPLSAIVEHTARIGGALGTDCMVGDHLLTLPGGRRVVVESKNTQALTLQGNGGILAELDRAMANRQADFAICVSAHPAFPAEVASFAVYGNRVLVVDDGEGTLLAVAVRWAAAALQPDRTAVDRRTIEDHLLRLRTFVSQFSAQRAALTEIGKSVERVRESLSDMRAGLLDLMDELDRRAEHDPETLAKAG